MSSTNVAPNGAITGNTEVFALLNTNTDSTSTSGIKEGGAFSVSSIFGLTAQPVGSYGMELNDGTSTHGVDQLERLIVTQSNGNTVIELAQRNLASNPQTNNIIATFTLTSTELSTDNQIEFQFTHAANAQVVSGSFELLDNGVVDPTIGAAGTVNLGTSSIFTNGVNWTRVDVGAFVNDGPSLNIATGASPKAGQTLTASAVTTNDSDATFVGYQWQGSSDGGTTWNAIAGATSSTYTVQESDEGTELRVLAIGSDSETGQITAPSVATGPVLDALPTVTVPIITGTAAPGQTLIASAAAGESDDTVSYAWYSSANGYTTAIGTGATYLVKTGDEGSTIEVKATATNDNGATITATSAATSAVAAGFLNQTITYQYLFPSQSSLYYQTSIAVGSGATHSGIDSGGPDVGNFTIGANQITFNYTSAGGWNGASYNGWHINESGASIVGFSVASTNVSGLSNANLSFDAHDLYVNWQGLTWTTGATTFDVTFDPPLDPSQVSIAQTLDGIASPASNAGALTVADGTGLALAGAIDNSGTVAVNGSTATTGIEIEGNVTLQGGGQINLSEGNENYIFGSDSSATLTNIDNTISGAGDIGAGSLSFTNAGLVAAQGPYALVIDTGSNAFVNTGTLATDGGTIIVSSPVTGGGNAAIAGGTLEFSGAVDSNVSFSGNNLGILALDQSQSFTGAIAGFGSQDQIDLGDIGFATGSTLGYTPNSDNSGGTLTASDGTNTANIALLGQYVASSFATASDGHGGTLISDPPAVAQNQLTQSHG